MQKKTPIEKYVKNAVKLGALDAKLISADTIVTAAWVRLKCRYGCGVYGHCLTCPPHSPTPQQTASVLEGYERALLVHGDDHVQVTRIVAKIERQAFLNGYYKAFAMGCGPCGLCGECNLDDKECLHPGEARPAMEACGIDVFQTARNNGFELEVARTRSSAQNYYGVILLE